MSMSRLTWVTGTLARAGELASGTNAQGGGAASATIVPVSSAARIALDLELPLFLAECLPHGACDGNGGWKPAAHGNLGSAW
jgi:hypothetical protein